MPSALPKFAQEAPADLAEPRVDQGQTADGQCDYREKVHGSIWPSHNASYPSLSIEHVGQSKNFTGR